MDNYKANFSWTPEFVVGVLDRCKEVESGARNVDHILTRTLLPELSAEFLSRMANEQQIQSASVSVDDEGRFTYDLR